MPQVPPSLELEGSHGQQGPTNNVATLHKMLSKVWQRMSTIVNGSLSFGNGSQSDNIAGAWVNVVTPVTPMTDFFVVHNLGRYPVGYQVHMKSAATDIFNGTQPNTTTRLCLQSTVGGVTVRLFVV